MKLVAKNDSRLNYAVHINPILKAGIFAIDEAIRKHQETIVYDCSLFNGVNPDHVIPFSGDQAILYDFKNHPAADVGVSLLYSLGSELSALFTNESNDKQWDELTEIVVRLMNKPIYFDVKDNI